MTALPKVTVAYAWDQGHPTGSIWDTLAEAQQHRPDEPALLVKVYLNSEGRIVHTEDADKEDA